MTITIGEDIVIGIAISIVGASIVALVGWLLRLQISALLRAAGSVPAVVYLWAITLVLLAVWIVAQFTDRSTDLSFKILTFVIAVVALLESISTKKKEKDPE